MGWAGLIAQGLGVISNYNAGKQNQKLANKQAGELQRQAAIKRVTTDIEVKDFNEMVNRELGRAKASTGASGFDASSGSAMAPVNALILRGELDAAAIRWSGEESARQLDKQANQYREYGKMIDRTTTSTTLTGLTEIAGDAYNYWGPEEPTGGKAGGKS